MPLVNSIGPGHKHLTRHEAHQICASVRRDPVWTRSALDWGTCLACRWRLISAADRHGPVWLGDALRTMKRLP